MPVKVPRSPFAWCPTCEGAGVIADAQGVMVVCHTCSGQGRLKVADPDAPPPRAARAPAPADPQAQFDAAAARETRARRAKAAEAAAGKKLAPPRKAARESNSTETGPTATGLTKSGTTKSGPTEAEASARLAPRPTAHEYFMGFAAHAAIRSKDTTKVGAVLVGPDGEVRLTGYNGPPKGVKDTPDRFERPRKYLFSSHAEQNVIAFAARQGIRTAGCTLYVTHHPCSSCARSIIQAGITCVVVGGAGFAGEWGEEIAAARMMFSDAGVKIQED